MIRIALAATAFLGATLALVLLLPGAGPKLPEEAAVTRADSLLSQPNAAPARLPLAAAPARPNPPQPSPAPRVAAPAPAVLLTDNSSLRDMTNGVLGELGLQPATSEAPQMRDMTANALANIGRVRPSASQPQPQPEKLQALIAQALKQGQSDSYIDALLNEAASRGEVTVPKALVTPEGRVDTATLLANIVASATAATQGKAPGDLAKGQPVGGKGVEVRMVTQADGSSVQYQFYTVGVGESLGAIAVKFYGDVAKFNMIFEANRTILSSPDKIRVGQRLVIPRA